MCQKIILIPCANGLLRFRPVANRLKNGGGDEKN